MTKYVWRPHSDIYFHYRESCWTSGHFCKVRSLWVWVFVCVCARTRYCPLLPMCVFVPQYLVKNPVEYVKKEEGQREACPWQSVNLLGSVDKELPHLFCAFATPTYCSRCNLGHVSCASWGAQHIDSVVGGAGFVVLAVARSGGHGGCGGQPALMCFPFLLEENTQDSERLQ